MGRINILKKLYFIFIFSILSGASFAIGFGEAKLYSYLNEPLNAEIELKGSEVLDPNLLVAKLANAKDFSRAGMQRPYFLTKLDFKVIRYKNQSVVLVTSKSAVKQPYLEFLLELSWPDGKLIKGYTLLMNPKTKNQVKREESIAEKLAAEQKHNKFDIITDEMLRGSLAEDLFDENASATSNLAAKADSKTKQTLPETINNINNEDIVDDNNFISDNAEKIQNEITKDLGREEQKKISASVNFEKKELANNAASTAKLPGAENLLDKNVKELADTSKKEVNQPGTNQVGNNKEKVASPIGALIKSIKDKPMFEVGESKATPAKEEDSLAEAIDDNEELNKATQLPNKVKQKISKPVEPSTYAKDFAPSTVTKKSNKSYILELLISLVAVSAIVGVVLKYIWRRRHEEMELETLDLEEGGEDDIDVDAEVAELEDLTELEDESEIEFDEELDEDLELDISNLEIDLDEDKNAYGSNSKAVEESTETESIEEISLPEVEVEDKSSRLENEEKAKSDDTKIKLEELKVEEIELKVEEPTVEEIELKVEEIDLGGLEIEELPIDTTSNSESKTELKLETTTTMEPEITIADDSSGLKLAATNESTQAAEEEMATITDKEIDLSLSLLSDDEEEIKLKFDLVSQYKDAEDYSSAKEVLEEIISSDDKKAAAKAKTLLEELPADKVS